MRSGDVEAPTSLVAQFREVFGLHSEQIALTTESTSSTFQEIAALRTDMHNRLDQVPVKPRDVVSLLLPNGVKYVAALWAVLEAGAIVAPLSPWSRRPELQAALRDSRARVIIVASDIDLRVTDPALMAREVANDVPTVDAVVDLAGDFTCTRGARAIEPILPEESLARPLRYLDELMTPSLHKITPPIDSRRVLPGFVVDVLFESYAAFLVALAVAMLTTLALVADHQRSGSSTVVLSVLIMSMALFYVAYHGAAIELERHAIVASVASRVGILLVIIFGTDRLLALRRSVDAREPAGSINSAPTRRKWNDEEGAESLRA